MGLGQGSDDRLTYRFNDASPDRDGGAQRPIPPRLPTGNRTKRRSRRVDGWEWLRSALGVLALLSLPVSLLPSPAAAQAPPTDSVTTTAAAGTLPMTLPAAVAIALRDNLSLRSSYLDRIVQRLSLRVAEQEFTPKLDIGAQAGVRRGQDGGSSNTLTTESRVGLKLPTGGSLAFLWSAGTNDAASADRKFDSGTRAILIHPLLRGAGTAIGRAPVFRARINERINLLSLKDTVISTVTSVIGLYRAYQQAIRQVEIARQGLERTQRQFEVNEALIAAGRLPPLENVQTNQRIASQELTVISAENAAESARIALALALNLSEQARIEPIEPLEPQRHPVDLERAYDTAFDYRSDWQVSLLRIRLADLSLVIAENDRLPRLDLEASAGRRADGGRAFGSALDESITGRPDWQARVAFALPTIGDLTPELNETTARVSRQQAQLTLDRLEGQIRADVRNAVREVELSWRRMELAVRARELAEQQLDIEQAKLQAGRTSNFQVLTFEQTLIDSRNAEIDATITYENALTRLDQVLGTTLDTWQIELQP